MLGLVAHGPAGTSPLRPGRTFAPTRPGPLSGSRPFGVNRNICNFLWYGVVVEGGLRAKVLGRLGWRLQAPSKSVCSILPIARCLSGRGILASLGCPGPWLRGERWWMLSWALTSGAFLRLLTM
jgi:hypothetical protein